MKLIINYDFFNAVRNAREPMSPYKIVRNNKDFFVFFSTLGCVYLLAGNMPTAASAFCSTALSPIVTAALFKKIGMDAYYNEASYRLRGLVPQLNDLNIATDYDLLLESELYHKKYNVEINEKKLPSLVESKYVLVPSYTYNGDVKTTSILQEHTVGSKQYVLSIGSPQRDYKLARCNT